MLLNIKQYGYVLIACLFIIVLDFIPQISFSSGWIAASILLWLSFSVYRRISGYQLTVRLSWAIFCSLFAALFAIHTFNSPAVLITEQQVSANADRISVFYNLDKLILGLIILFTSQQMIKTQARQNKINRVRLSVFYLFACAVIFSFAVSLTIVHFEPKLLPAGFFLIWAFKNLVLVCFGEELLFRGFIQKELSNWHPVFAWLITSALFGLAHLPAGPAFAFIATLAGLLYGWIYLKTNNIWLAVLAHFVFNCLHLLFFTYPYLTNI